MTERDAVHQNVLSAKKPQVVSAQEYEQVLTIGALWLLYLSPIKKVAQALFTADRLSKPFFFEKRGKVVRDAG